jgi:ribosomal protein L23
MAFFSKKQNIDVKVAVPGASSVASQKQELSWVLVNPRITEKATDVGAVSAYVFNISPKAHKREVTSAIKAVYKVTPRMVRIVPVRAKNVRNARTGMMGVKTGGKKAYVYLKKGDTINVV